jgi:hypothetical protein
MYTVHLVGYFQSCITMHVFMNVKNISYFRIKIYRLFFIRRMCVCVCVRAFTVSHELSFKCCIHKICTSKYRVIDMDMSYSRWVSKI